MKKNSFLSLWSVMALVFVCTGCASYLQNMQDQVDTQAQEEIRTLQQEVTRLENALSQKYMDLIYWSRVRNLNIAREKASERMLSEAILRYKCYMDLGRAVESVDRTRLNSPGRYYGIVTHSCTDKADSMETARLTNDGWTLVLSGDGFLEKNCLYQGIILNAAEPRDKFRNKINLSGKVAYAVVLTPVTKAGTGQMSVLALESPETDYLKGLLPTGRQVGSYRIPIAGYMRAQPGKPLAGYAVRGYTKIDAAGNDHITCMSKGLPYNPGSFNYIFPTPLLAFRGDIVGVIIPRDDYLKYTTVRKGAEASQEMANLLGNAVSARMGGGLPLGWSCFPKTDEARFTDDQEFSLAADGTVAFPRILRYTAHVDVLKHVPGNATLCFSIRVTPGTRFELEAAFFKKDTEKLRKKSGPLFVSTQKETVTLYFSQPEKAFDDKEAFDTLTLEVKLLEPGNLTFDTPKLLWLRPADSYYAISKGIVEDMLTGSQSGYINGNGGAFLPITAKMRFDQKYSEGHRAAFTFYGDYLLPSE